MGDAPFGQEEVVNLLPAVQSLVVEALNFMDTSREGFDENASSRDSNDSPLLLPPEADGGTGGPPEELVETVPHRRPDLRVQRVQPGLLLLQGREGIPVKGLRGPGRRVAEGVVRPKRRPRPIRCQDRAEGPGNLILTPEGSIVSCHLSDVPKASSGRTAFKAFWPTHGGWKSPLKKTAQGRPCLYIL